MNAQTPNRGRRFGSGRQRRPIRSGLGDRVLGWFEGGFQRLLDRVDAGLMAGTIDVTLPDGRTRRLGGRGEGPEAVVHLASWRALLRLATGGSIGWYVAWSRGEWSSPDPVPLFDLFSRNVDALGDTARASGVARLLSRLSHLRRSNHRIGSRRNIAFHYDLGNDFYALWLDPSMTYSSALFADLDDPAEPLEAAQQGKLAAILERTATVPGDTILEIGCGWGSFAEAAARAGRQVHGLTLSSEQKAWADRRIADAGLEARISLRDYREEDEQYDAVASIEMVEAVGEEYWPAYLAAIARALKPGGRAAIQFIGMREDAFERYARSADFIQRYVFPGGMLLSEQRFAAIAAQHGLGWHDRVGFGLHYAETLRRWRKAFEAAIDAGRLPPEFDQHFVDLWRYYLMYCEGGFRGGAIDVVQVTLIKR